MKIILARLVQFSLVRLFVLQKTVRDRVGTLLGLSVFEKTVGYGTITLLSLLVLQKTIGDGQKQSQHASRPLIPQKSVRNGGTSSYLDCVNSRDSVT